MRKALVIGVDNYPSSPLRGCVNDAAAIAGVLEANGDGSPNFDVRLITSPSNMVDRASLRKSIQELFASKCDAALFYFSGHGLIKSTGGFLVTTDYAQYDEGVSMDELLSYANQSPAQDKIIILDCCHSGAAGTPIMNENNMSQLKEGLSVLTASRDSESALEINGRGVFTSLVVDGLNGGAADLRGHVTPGSIYAYVDQALGPWDQRPIFKTNVTRFTSLRSITPRVPLEKLRKITEYFKTPSDEFQLDPSYEFTSDAPNDEHVKIFQDLQKFFSVGLVVPVGEEFMYFAAMNSKSCRLTASGYQYWRLVNDKRI
jgi:hypothetical protein